MSSKPRPKRDRSKEAEENQTAATDIAEMDVEEMRNALIAERNKTQALEAEKVAQQLATAEREAERTKAEKASRAADNERMALLERKVEVLTSGKEKESPKGRPPYKTQDQPESSIEYFNLNLNESKAPERCSAIYEIWKAAENKTCVVVFDKDHSIKEIIYDYYPKTSPKLNSLDEFNAPGGCIPVVVLLSLVGGHSEIRAFWGSASSETFQEQNIYTRRGHFIGYCVGDCRKIHDGDAEAKAGHSMCNCAAERCYDNDVHGEPAHGANTSTGESPEASGRQLRQFPFVPSSFSDGVESSEGDDGGSATGTVASAASRGSNEKSRFGAEEAYLGTGEMNGAKTYDANNGNADQDNNDEGNGDNSLHGALRINAIRAYTGCDRESCGEKPCPSNHHYNQALMEWLTTAVVADGEPRRTYKNDMAEAYQAMNRELQKGEEMLLDSGSNIHLLTLQHARRYFASQRSTRMTVLGISGVRDRCSAEGEVILLVKDNNGKQLRLSLGLGYSSSSVPKSLLSAARLMEDVAILHFEKGNSYIEFPNQGQRIPLIERGGLFYVPAVNIGIADGEMDSPKYAAQGSNKGASFLGFASEVDAKEACASYAADAKGKKEKQPLIIGDNAVSESDRLSIEAIRNIYIDPEEVDPTPVDHSAINQTAQPVEGEGQVEAGGREEEEEEEEEEGAGGATAEAIQAIRDGAHVAGGDEDDEDDLDDDEHESRAKRHRRLEKKRASAKAKQEEQKKQRKLQKEMKQRAAKESLEQIDMRRPLRLTVPGTRQKRSVADKRFLKAAKKGGFELKYQQRNPKKKGGRVPHRRRERKVEVGETPNVSFGGNTMPRKAHAAVVNRLIQYVYNTRKLGIRYQRDCAQEKDAPKNYGQGRHPLDTGKNHLAAFVDSDYAADSSRRSRQGSITMMNGGPIAWASILGKTICCSTCEAEVMAAVSAAKESVHLKLLLGELGVHHDGIRIEEDNTAYSQQGRSARSPRTSSHGLVCIV